MKIKLCGKRLYPTESVKYLGVKIDTNLNWEHNVNDLSIKLNKANDLLFKMRKYVKVTASGLEPTNHLVHKRTLNHLAKLAK